MYNIVNNIVNIEDYKPIYKVDNKFVINFNKVDILEPERKKVNGRFIETGEQVPSGKCIYSSFTCPDTLSVNDIVNKIYEIIDNETKFVIANQFVWNDYKVFLSQENQMNYKNAFDLAIATNGESLPVTFKFKKGKKNEYYTFDTVSELKDFYIKMNKFINNCLQNGWNKKDNVTPEDYKI